jgi:phage shock protein A
MNRTPPDPAPGFESRSTFPDLDAAYRRQLETLARVRRAVAAVATSRKKLELRLSQLEQESSKPEGEPTSEVREVRRQSSR